MRHNTDIVLNAAVKGYAKKDLKIPKRSNRSRKS